MLVPHALPPSARGLYDPRHEHDACGVGFVVHAKGHRSHAIVRHALRVLMNLEHRGACGCEANTGDGAGILIQMPDRFFRKEAARLRDAAPPAEGSYGAGLVFLPKDADARSRVTATIERIVREEGQQLLGWRDVPTNDSELGPRAVAAEPIFKQLFIARADSVADGDAFERKLYVIRKRIEHEVDALGLSSEAQQSFYVVGLSSRTLIYKGMLTASQIAPLFLDLSDETVESALALVHQRFSTNTFPSWPLAHPYRYVAHNGEINTLRGNINWMKAREALLQSDVLGDDLKKVLPIIREGGSDTATFDNVLEFLVMAGRSLAHAVLMMIPEPWQNHESISPERRAFYEYHSSLMEPWDGPASIAFTDGRVIGAVLDRNGLRPSRYYVTKDDLVVLASEVGVLDIPPEDVIVKERLHPGKMFLVDTEQGRIISDDEIKDQLAREHPYAEWLKQNLIPIEAVPAAPYLPEPDHETVLRRQQAFGYTREDVKQLLEPMARAGEEPVGSMGTDTPLAVLSDKPRLLYDYFKQLFAQVTNPPLDAIREELITSMESTVGPERNLLRPEPESCRQISIRYPIIDNSQLAKLRHIRLKGFSAVTLPMLFRAADGAAGLERALDELNAQASHAVDSGYTILILSDRGVSEEFAPIPSLLATAGVHHHLVRQGARTRCALVVESGDAREVHHVALLMGYGAGAVNPYLAFESLEDMLRQRLLEGIIARQGGHQLHPRAEQGHSEGDVEDGDLDAAELLRRADLRGDRTRVEVRRSLLHPHGVADRRRGPRGCRERSPEAAHARVPDEESGSSGSRAGRRISVAARRRVPPVQPRHGLQAAARHAQRAIPRVQGIHDARQRPEPPARYAAGPAGLQADAAGGCPGRSRTGRVDRQALRHGGDVVRIDQPRGTRDARHRDEPDGRSVQLR